MKTNEGIMDLLAAYDLAESYRAAADLAGCDTHTVARRVAARQAGQLSSAGAAGAGDRPVPGASRGVGGAEPRADPGRCGPAEAGDVAVSSNLHPAGFDELMPKTLASATVDRLLHHAHVCVTQGESVRLAQATDGRGVLPLSPPPEARRG